MKEPPNKLRCVNGKIVMSDGSDPTEYLKQWIKLAEVKPNTPIIIVRRDTYEDLRGWAMIAQHWGA